MLGEVSTAAQGPFVVLGLDAEGPTLAALGRWHPNCLKSDLPLNIFTVHIQSLGDATSRKEAGNSS